MGKLIVDGNAVYEIDEHCMQRKQMRRARMHARTGNDRQTGKRNIEEDFMREKSSGQAGSTKTGGK